MTLQMAIGKMILDKVITHPREYPRDLVQAAKEVIRLLPKWSSTPQKKSFHEGLWHLKSVSWRMFKKLAEESNVDLPGILTEDETQ